MTELGEARSPMSLGTAPMAPVTRSRRSSAPGSAPWSNPDAQAGRPGGFTLDDFTIDEQAGTVTCPNGLTRPITKTRTVTFGAGCRGCPLRALCTTRAKAAEPDLHSTTGCCGTTASARKTPPGRADYRQHRPMVERSIAWLVAGGNRKVRYRGIAKNNAWLHTPHRSPEPAPTAQPRPHPTRRCLAGRNSLEAGPQTRQAAH